MTKPQRYTFLSPYSIDTTCLEFDIDHMPDNPDDIIVKYNDHITEVVNLEKNYVLQIKELQAELDSLKNDPMTKKHYNQIIADWIEAHGFEMDGDVLIREGHLAKLRGNDEAT